MVASTLQAPTRGWFDVLDDWLKRPFVFIGWSGLLLFTLCLPVNRRLVRWNYFRDIMVHMVLHPHTLREQTS